MFKIIKKSLLDFYLMFYYSFVFKPKSNNKLNRGKLFFNSIGYFFRNGNFDNNYLVYEIYKSGLTSSGSFVGRRELKNIKGRVENALKLSAGNQGLNYDIVCKDKFYNTSILKSNGIPIIPTVALISNSLFIRANGTVCNAQEFFDRIEFPCVIKHVALEYNEGFFILDKKENKHFLNGQELLFDKIMSKLKQGKWVVQRIVKSNAQIRKINCSALNTTRIVTINDGKNPKYLTGFQAFACGTEKTDSWGKGAVYVGIDPFKDELSGFGYFHPTRGAVQTTVKHPDSNIEFDKYRIDGLKEAVELCISAHRYCYFQFLIGWDVAITDEGPVIVEANENPGMNAVQIINGGIKEKVVNIANDIIDAR